MKVLLLLWIIFCVMISILMAIGYVLNIIDLVHMNHVLDTGLGILRVIGIFVPPLGAILGWFW